MKVCWKIISIRRFTNIPFIYILLIIQIFNFSVGFSNVVASDLTQDFVNILKTELEKFKPQKDQFIKVFISVDIIRNKKLESNMYQSWIYETKYWIAFQDFSLKDYNDLVDGWDIKVVRCSDGLQGWGLFTATKKI